MRLKRTKFMKLLTNSVSMKFWKALNICFLNYTFMKLTAVLEKLKKNQMYKVL